ncbi:MAG: ABC transporter permease [Planctomycetes bacterium]|nr:ABC transporter permease [Planctomycetota bacterium]
MKYFAILKDSMREARDSWILIGLFALSTLVIIFVAQLSFKPLSAEKTMGYFFPSDFQGPVIFQTLNNHKPEKMMVMRGWGNFRLNKVELIRGDADSPLSDYALTVSASDQRRFGFGPEPMIAHDEEKKGPGQEPKRPPVDRKAEAGEIRKLFEDAENLNFIKVGGIEPIAHGEDHKGLREYRVVVQGTPNTHRIWATELGLVFGLFPIEFISAPLAALMYNLATLVIKVGSWAAVLLGVVITAFFIPNMLRKGTIDLLLVKPISRSLLLSYKYLGGLTFIFLSTAYAIAGIWFVLGIRSGLWATGTLLLILTITFFFAILYAISTFVGVMTRSVVTSILLTVAAWIAFSSIGLTYTFVDMIERMEKEDDKMRQMMGQAERPQEKRWAGHWVLTAVRVIHAISPRTEDLNQLNDLIVYTDFMTGNLGDMNTFDNSKSVWWESLLVSAIWIGIFVGLASLWFYFKDY